MTELLADTGISTIQQESKTY